ncbi:hypothetical protein ACQCT5_10300 [Sutcliffiella halmapala]
MRMSLEEIQKRYAKGYDYTVREHRNQLYNDMEWLMDEVLKLKSMIENGVTFEDLYNPDDEINPHCR